MQEQQLVAGIDAEGADAVPDRARAALADLLDGSGGLCLPVVFQRVVKLRAVIPEDILSGELGNRGAAVNITADHAVAAGVVVGVNGGAFGADQRVRSRLETRIVSFLVVPLEIESRRVHHVDFLPGPRADIADPETVGHGVVGHPVRFPQADGVKFFQRTGDADPWIIVRDVVALGVGVVDGVDVGFARLQRRFGGLVDDGFAEWRAALVHIHAPDAGAHAVIELLGVGCGVAAFRAFVAEAEVEKPVAAEGQAPAIVAAGGVELLDHDQLAGGIERRVRGIPGEAGEPGIVRVEGVDGGVRVVGRVVEVVDVEEILALRLAEFRVERAAEDAAVFVGGHADVPIHVPDAAAQIEHGGDLRGRGGVLVRQAENPAIHFSNEQLARPAGPWQGDDRRLPGEIRECLQRIHLRRHDGQRGQRPIRERSNRLGSAEPGDAFRISTQRDGGGGEIRWHHRARIFSCAPLQRADEGFMKCRAPHAGRFLLVAPDVAVGRGVDATAAVSDRPLDRMVQRGLPGGRVRIDGVGEDRHIRRHRRIDPAGESHDFEVGGKPRVGQAGVDRMAGPAGDQRVGAVAMAGSQPGAGWMDKQRAVGIDRERRAGGGVVPGEADDFLIFLPIGECLIRFMEGIKPAAVLDVSGEGGLYGDRPRCVSGRTPIAG